MAIALVANSISAIWASGESKLSLWLIALILISPLVFITFGLTTERIGVTVSSGTIDALLTIGTIAVGLIAFKEWDTLTAYQYAGIILTIVGIILLNFNTK